MVCLDMTVTFLFVHLRTGQSSNQAVLRWAHAVQDVVPQVLSLPADRIVKRVRARVAPMPIEVELGERGLGAAELEELVRDPERGSVGRDARLGDAERGRERACFRGVGTRDVDELRAAPEEEARGVEILLEFPDTLDDQGSSARRA